VDDVIIRDIKAEDIEEMAIVRHHVWETTYRGIYEDSVIDQFDYEHVEESFREKMMLPDTIFKVATVNNKIVGYVCFGKNTTEERYKDYDYLIHYIHISKEYQGKGLGTKFFKMIMNYAIDNNVSKFYVICNKYNYSAHKYYEKMGGAKDYESDDVGEKQDQHVIYVYAVGGVQND
jgi:RimJ/RimL family protein N-acetyltransferase